MLLEKRALTNKIVSSFDFKGTRAQNRGRFEVSVVFENFFSESGCCWFWIILSLINLSEMPSSLATFFILFALFFLAVSRRLSAFDPSGLIQGDKWGQYIFLFGTFSNIIGLKQTYHCSSWTLMLLQQSPWRCNSVICLVISSNLALQNL